MAPEWVLSIDFGTSNTAAAHSAVVDGSVETLSLSHASDLIPSGVYVASPENIATGDQAINEAHRNPGGYLPSPKRLIDQPSVSVNGHTIPTWLPIAAVLSAVVRRALSAHAGRLPDHVALTHPEAWSPGQIRTLFDAAVNSGIPAHCISTISEPRAAAAYYGRSTHVAVGARVAVFDFGGGTLDVAVLRKESEASFGVIAARGDNSLGGKNFDATIRQWVDGQLMSRNPELAHHLRREAPAGVRFQLDESVRRAKELLSETPSATITVAGGGHHETFQITRDEFDELVTPAIDSARRLTRATLADAGITRPEDLSVIYLTGGTTRIPLVHSFLASLGPVATLDDPKTVVAKGALAAYLVHRPAPNPDPPQATQPVTPPTTPPPPTIARPKKGPRIALVGVGVVAVIAAVVVAVMVLTGGDSDDAPPGARPSSAVENSATEVTLSTNQSQVLAAMPAILRDGVETCVPSSFTLNDGVAVRCFVRGDSGLLDGIALARFTQAITVSNAGIDQRQSRTDLTAMAQTDSYIAGADPDTGATVDGGGTGSSWTARYIDKRNYFLATFNGFADEASAKKFLANAGFIPSS